LTAIAKYFGVGMKDAETYVSILTKEQITEICQKFEYGKNGKQNSIKD
jgi:recombinational DNA repair protein RecT